MSGTIFSTICFNWNNSKGDKSIHVLDLALGHKSDKHQHLNTPARGNWLTTEAELPRVLVLCQLVIPRLVNLNYGLTVTMITVLGDAKRWQING